MFIFYLYTESILHAILPPCLMSRNIFACCCMGSSVDIFRYVSILKFTSQRVCHCAHPALKRCEEWLYTFAWMCLTACVPPPRQLKHGNGGQLLPFSWVFFPLCGGRRKILLPRLEHSQMHAKPVRLEEPRTDADLYAKRYICKLGSILIVWLLTAVHQVVKLVQYKYLGWSAHCSPLYTKS